MRGPASFSPQRVAGLGSAPVFGRRCLAFFGRAGPSLAMGGLVLLLLASVLTATGVFGHVVLGADQPKDAALVLSLVWHGVLGVVITLLQCLMGAGAIRIFSK